MARVIQFLRARPYEVVLAHMKMKRRRCKRYTEQHISHAFLGPRSRMPVDQYRTSAVSQAQSIVSSGGARPMLLRLESSSSDTAEANASGAAQKRDRRCEAV